MTTILLLFGFPQMLVPLFFGVSTVAGIPDVAALPSAVNVCDVSIVPAAANSTVANVLQRL
jgi:hypothetical protein